MNRPEDKENLWVNVDIDLKRELVAYSKAHKKTPLAQCARAGLELFMSLPDEVKAILLNLDRHSHVFKQAAEVARQAIVTVAMPGAAAGQRPPMTDAQARKLAEYLVEPAIAAGKARAGQQRAKKAKAG
jgi:hypothetical protein